MALRDAATIVRIGTRGSDLALWQTAEVARLMRASHPGITIEHRVIRTTGDRDLGTPLARIGTKGLFTKELEEALTGGSVDIVVHSLKDLPTGLPDGLTLAAVLERDDPRDVLVSTARTSFAALRAGARIATSSLRRRAQLLACNRFLTLVDVRGNVTTRLAKLDHGEFDALVLARAGLVRLGLETRIAETFDIDVLVPAVGQAAIAVEARATDARVCGLLREMDHRPTRLATFAERALLARLEGGCQVPIGALATWRDDTLTLTAIVADVRGEGTVRGAASASVRTEAEAARLGTGVAERLLDRGAASILARIRSEASTVEMPGRAGER